MVPLVDGTCPARRGSSLVAASSARPNALKTASQMWWELREEFRLGKVCVDVDDPRLLEDLTAPRYTVSGDKVIKVESKDEIRKRIGRSTDAGDGAVYAWADLGMGPITGIKIPEAPRVVREGVT